MKMFYNFKIIIIQVIFPYLAHHHSTVAVSPRSLLHARRGVDSHRRAPCRHLLAGLHAHQLLLPLRLHMLPLHRHLLLPLLLAHLLLLPTHHLAHAERVRNLVAPWLPAEVGVVLSDRRLIVDRRHVLKIKGVQVNGCLLNFICFL